MSVSSHRALSFVTLLILGELTFGKALDTGSLKYKSSAEELKASNPAESTQEYLNIRFDDSDIPALKARIDAMRLIIFNRPPKEGLSRLQIRFATINLKLANVLRKKTLEVSKEEKVALKSALSAANYILQSKTSFPKDEVAVAHYLAGMARVYGEQPILAIKHFQSSLKIAPRSEQALSMLMFLGEYYFETSKFQTALYFYREALKLNRDDHRNFIRYKLAWTYMNLEKFKLAEEEFLNTILDSKNEDFIKESLNDLAYLEAMIRSEAQILDFYKNKFSRKPEYKTRFITTTSHFLGARGRLGEMKGIIQLVTGLQEGAIERIKVRLAVVANLAKKVASKAHYEAFKKIMDEVEKNPDILQDASFEALKPDLIAETEALVKSLTESYNLYVVGTQKAKRNGRGSSLSRSDLARYLKSVSYWHRSTFPLAENRKIVTNVLLGLCLDQRDFTCVEETTKQVLNNSSMQELHRQAKLDRIEALEVLREKNKAFEEEYVEMLKSFAQTPTRDASWVQVAKRLSTYYIQQGHYKASLPLSQEIYKIEKDKESLYRVKVSRFGLGQYEDVTDGEGGESQKGNLSDVDQKLLNLKREATLKLVIKAKDAGDNVGYENNIRSYLKLQPEGEKSLIVVKDFIVSLMEKRDYNKLIEIWQIVPSSARSDKSFRKIIRTLSYQMLLTGHFNQSFSLLKQVESRESETNYLYLVSKLGSQGQLIKSDFKRIEQLKRSQKENILELMSISIPELYTSYYWTLRKPNKKQMRLMLLSIQLLQGQQKVSLSYREQVSLAPILPPSMKAYPRTQTEKLLLGIRFPSSNTNLKAATQQIQTAVNTLVKSRALISQDLKKAPLEARLRILDTAIRNESKMAESILNSPLPKGLNPKDRSAYKSQLQQMARQYSAQASEYLNVKRQVQKLLRQNSKEKGFITLVDLEEWPWPNDVTSQSIKKFIDANNLVGALVMGDLNLEKGKIGTSDYWTLRAGGLLKKWTHWQGVNYVKAELKNVNQMSLYDYLQGRGV